jgi:hypothetical protein
MVNELENKRYDLLQQFFYLMVTPITSQEKSGIKIKLSELKGAIENIDQMLAEYADEDYKNVVMQISIIGE